MIKFWQQLQFVVFIQLRVICAWPNWQCDQVSLWRCPKNQGSSFGCGYRWVFPSGLGGVVTIVQVLMYMHKWLTERPDDGNKSFPKAPPSTGVLRILTCLKLEGSSNLTHLHYSTQWLVCLNYHPETRDRMAFVRDSEPSCILLSWSNKILRVRVFKFRGL